MAAIIASNFILGHAQADGRCYVIETHTWDGGIAPTVLEYGPISAALDHQAIANARAEQLMDAAAEREFQELLRGA